MCYHLCDRTAAAVPHLALQDELAQVLDEYDLRVEDRERIRATVPARIEQVKVGDLRAELREHILLAVTMLCERASWSGDLPRLFHAAAERLGFASADGVLLETLRERARARGNAVEGLFAACQHLFHRVDTAQAGPFLDALAGQHPQRSRLEETLRTGDLVSSLLKMAVAATGDRQISQAVGFLWGLCRNVATAQVRTDGDGGYGLLAGFFQRELRRLGRP